MTRLISPPCWAIRLLRNGPTLHCWVSKPSSLTVLMIQVNPHESKSQISWPLPTWTSLLVWITSPMTIWACSFHPLVRKPPLSWMIFFPLQDPLVWTRMRLSGGNWVPMWNSPMWRKSWKMWPWIPRLTCFPITWIIPSMWMWTGTWHSGSR